MCGIIEFFSNKIYFSTHIYIYSGISDGIVLKTICTYSILKRMGRSMRLLSRFAKCFFFNFHQKDNLLGNSLFLINDILLKKQGVHLR